MFHNGTQHTRGMSTLKTEIRTKKETKTERNKTDNITTFNRRVQNNLIHCMKEVQC